MALTILINAYDRRMTELEIHLMTNQEHYLSESKYDFIIAKLLLQISDLCSDLSSLKASLAFATDGLHDSKAANNTHWLEEDHVDRITARR